ncbi:MAG TPA: DUF2147 domain-containing protein [Hyphomicrobium sp.]|jgi:uncharacterized protein (DUF2147 family)
MRINATALTAAAISATLLSAVSARAAENPLGVWIDHTGRGAVEITDCNGKLCGYVAWAKDSKDAESCGYQIIGDVKPIGGGTWDNGWIYDPDRDDKFDVEIKPIGADKLRVTGYAGIKWLSETMTWKRAPAELQKCSKTGTEAKAAPAAKTNATAEAKPDAKSETKLEVKAEAKTDTTVEKTDTKVETNEQAKADDKAPEVENDKQANAPDADEPETKSDKKGKAAAKIAEALNFRKSKGGNCKINVPYLDAEVTFPCDE